MEPTFADDPWYDDNPTPDANLRYESFMVNELVPWGGQRPGHQRAAEQNWLIGFSKSGDRGPGPDP